MPKGGGGEQSCLSPFIAHTQSYFAIRYTAIFLAISFGTGVIQTSKMHLVIKVTWGAIKNLAILVVS